MELSALATFVSADSASDEKKCIRCFIFLSGLLDFVLC